MALTTQILNTSPVYMGCRLFMAALSLLGQALYAAPVVEKIDRLEVNWSDLRVRYYGQATVDGAASESDWDTAARRARVEGLDYAVEAVKTLQQNALKVDDVSEVVKAAKRASSASTSYNTVYFANGTVRVLLETDLQLPPLASAAPQAAFARGSASPYTGIVLRLSKSIKPRASYQIVDEAGTILFSATDRSPDAYQKSLMGRWFRRATPGELSAAVGDKPLVVEAQVEADERLLIPRSVWEAGAADHRFLLIHGDIALSLP